MSAPRLPAMTNFPLPPPPPSPPHLHLLLVHLALQLCALGLLRLQHLALLVAARRYRGMRARYVCGTGTPLHAGKLSAWRAQCSCNEVGAIRRSGCACRPHMRRTLNHTQSRAPSRAAAPPRMPPHGPTRPILPLFTPRPGGQEQPPFPMAARNAALPQGEPEAAALPASTPFPLQRLHEPPPPPPPPRNRPPTTSTL